jgi:hypothetical protein
MVTTHNRIKQHNGFPLPLGRFTKLGGGMYGTLEVVALTPKKLEFQTGEDFIQFDREQVEKLRDELDRFLNLECGDEPHSDRHGHHDHDNERSEVVVDEALSVAVQESGRQDRPTRRRKAGT